MKKFMKGLLATTMVFAMNDFSGRLRRRCGNR